MLNQMIMVGRLLQTNEERKEIVVSVPRPYKNEDGIYENDEITVKVMDGILNNVLNYCKVGDILGVKGRIKATKTASGSDIELVAERIIFLSSKSDQIKKEMEN